jgi:glycosyltransferase involved in cell wall biosynthesis
MKKAVCMIAYANYYTDARIKNYVEALAKAGYEIDIFALGSSEAECQKGVRVFLIMQKYWGRSAIVYAFSQIWFALAAAMLVSCHYLKKRYGLIHVHNIPNFLVFAAIIPRIFGSKVILDVHDTMPEAYATKFDLEPDHPLIWFLKLEERLSALFADLVITTNDLHKEVLVSHGIDGDKIEIIMNVGNERIFSPDTNHSKNSGLNLVYHGTVAERLGIDLILRAIFLSKRECAELHFLLIGEGDYLANIKSMVKEFGLERDVKIIGFLPVERLRDFISEADVGIVGNRAYTEAKQNYMLPVKMLEYAAMEIPTIAPRLRVIQHYFDEDSAIYYEPDDAEDMADRITELYRNRERLGKVREKLKSFNQRHNWSSMGAKYLGIVDRLGGKASEA